MMQHNPYDLIIIKKDMVPNKHIEELMLLTNNKEGIKQAQVINKDDDGNNTHEEKIENRNTLWYDIPEKEAAELQRSISHIWQRYIVLKESQ